MHKKMAIRKAERSRRLGSVIKYTKQVKQKILRSEDKNKRRKFIEWLRTSRPEVHKKNIYIYIQMHLHSNDCNSNIVSNYKILSYNVVNLNRVCII